MVKNADALSKAVGKLIVGKVAAAELDDATKNALRTGTMGGITLFKENAVDLEQLFRLVEDIHQNSAHPPIIAVDQEGGPVQRFDHVLTPLPSAMSLAACEDLEQVKAITEISARQLSLLGINCLLSPVLDVCSNPLNPIIGTRSFGDDPQRITEMGSLVAETLRDYGIIAVGKHFPGHGDTLEDSHSLLAVNETDATLLWQREMVPFRGCINYLPAILTAHVWLPAVDSEKIPASLSPKVTTGLLRQYLGFDGQIFTDDLLMKAITNNWGLEEAAILAVLAGADRLLVCGTIEQSLSVHAALMQAVKSGRIEESIIKRASERIADVAPPPKLSSEARLAELQKAVVDDRETCLQTATSAIAILRGHAPEIDSGNWIIVAPEHPRYKIDLQNALSHVLKKSGKTDESIIKQIRYPLDPSAAICKSIAEECTGLNCIYLTYRTLAHQGQVKLGRKLADVTENKVTIATDVPYDLIGLPRWENGLATFDPSDLAIEALAEVLYGNAAAGGVCPVSLELQL